MPAAKKAVVKNNTKKTEAAKSKNATSSNKTLSRSSSGPIELSPKEVKAIIANKNRKCLGRGGFGFVYAMKFRGQLCAVKIGFKKRDDDGDSGEDILQKEIKMTIKGQVCTRVINAIAYHKGDKKAGSPPLLILEWAAKGDLIGKRLSWATALDKVKQLFDGLAELHANGLVHFDIKPENLLVNDKDEVRIADFGFAMSLRSAYDLLGGESSGSPGYEPPECIMKRLSNKRLGGQCTKVDVFGAGITAAVILGSVYVKTYPAEKEDLDIMGNAVEKSYGEVVLDLRKDLKVSHAPLRKFFMRVCARDAKDRATAKEGSELLQAMIDELPKC